MLILHLGILKQKIKRLRFIMSIHLRDFGFKFAV
jgi:hypothetical protein